MFLTEDEVLLG